MQKLTDVFNGSNSGINLYEQSDCVLRVSNGILTNYYDFAQRIMITAAGKEYLVTPFSKLDPEVIEAVHEALVAKRGQDSVPVLKADEKPRPVIRLAGSNSPG